LTRAGPHDNTRCWIYGAGSLTRICSLSGQKKQSSLPSPWLVLRALFLAFVYKLDLSRLSAGFISEPLTGNRVAASTGNKRENSVEQETHGAGRCWEGPAPLHGVKDMASDAASSVSCAAAYSAMLLRLSTLLMRQQAAWRTMRSRESTEQGGVYLCIWYTSPLPPLIVPQEVFRGLPTSQKRVVQSIRAETPHR
jgi:hypothetical protein